VNSAERRQRRTAARRRPAPFNSEGTGRGAGCRIERFAL